MKLKVFVICIFLIGCFISRKFEVKKFGKYRIKVPNGYLYRGIVMSTHGVIHYYLYEDSILFYFGNEHGGERPNHDNIDKIKEAKRIHEAIFEGGIYDITGMNDKNLFWRELFYNRTHNKIFFVGYSNVPMEKKPLFDSAINLSFYKW